MARTTVRVDVHPEGLVDLLRSSPEIRSLLAGEASKVKAAADATAQEAQNGPGGTLSGYAEAGFSVVWEMRGRRPRILITSNADPEMALRVHFYTQKRDGISHLRAALRSIT